MKKQLVLISLLLLCIAKTYSQRIYFSESNQGRIRYASLLPNSIGTPTSFITGLTSPSKVVVAQNTSKLYYLTAGGGDLIRANLYTGAQESVVITRGAMAEYYDIAFYPDDDGLFAANGIEVDGISFVPSANNDGGNDVSVNVGGYSNDFFTSVAVDNDGGFLYLANDDVGRILSMPIGSGNPTVLASLTSPSHIAYDWKNNDLYIVAYVSSSYRLYRYDLDSNALSAALANLGTSEIDDLEVYPGYNKIYYSVYNTGIYSLPFTGGTGTLEMSLPTSGSINFSFQNDFSSPVFTALSPADGTVTAAPDQQFTMTFDEAIQLSTTTGTTNETSIRLMRWSDNSLVETLSRSSANVSVSGTTATFKFTSSLALGTEYYILIGSKVFKDASANDFIGISLNSGWNIKTTGGVFSNSPSAIACVGTYKSYPDIYISEGSSADFQPGVSVTMTFGFSGSGYTFENTTGTITAEPGRDLTINSYSITNTSITITFTASTTTASDAILISGLKMRSTADGNPSTTVVRSGGTATVYGLPTGTAIATVTTQAQPAPPTFTQPEGSQICLGGDVSAYSVTATGTSIRWYTANDLLTASHLSGLANMATVTAADLTVSSTTTGTISRYVRQNVAGCSSLAAQVDFIIVDAPQTVTTSSTSNTSCSVGNGSVSVVDVDGAGTSNYVFEWFDQEMAPLGATGTTLSALNTGTYHVTAKHTTTGCISAPVAVSVLDEVQTPLIELSPTPNSNCETANGSLTASITNQVGPISDYSFSWHQGPDTEGPVLPSNTSIANNLPAGQYTVRVVHSNTSCVGVQTSLVTESFAYPEPVPPSGNVCETTAGSGTASVNLTTYNSTITGGNANYTVTWVDNANNPVTTVTVSDNDSYTYHLKNTTNGCQTSSALVFNVEPMPTQANAGPDQTRCATNATLAANTPVVGAGAWSVVSGAGGSFSSTSNPAATFSGTVNTTYVLRWTVTATGCSASTDDVTIILENTPSVASAGADQTACGSTTLSGNTPTVGTGTWTVISGAGGSIAAPTDPTTTFTGVEGRTYTLRWTISNASCTPSTDDVVITMSSSPTAASAGVDQTMCDTSTTLTANTPSTGTGAWSVISGTGGTFADASSATSPFRGTAGQTYVLRWTITSTPCPQTFDEVTIQLNGQPSTANAGADKTICGTSVAMTGNAPSTGTGTWTVVSGTGGSFANPLSPTSTFTGIAGNNYTLRWTISNTGCTSSTDDVAIALQASPTVANAGADQSVCLTSATLAANTPSVGTGTWTVISGAGGTLTNSASATSGFTGTADITYTLRWTITNGSCPSSTDDVSITLTNPVTTAQAGADQEKCGATTTLSANPPTSGTGSWSIISGTGGSVGSPSNPASAFNGVAGNTYTLRWTIAKSGCSSSTDDVVIVLKALPQGTGTISPLADICTGASTTLSVSGIANATSYDWSVPAGVSIDSDESVSVTVTANSGAGGNFSVTPMNECGAGTPVSTPIEVLPLPSVNVALPPTPFPGDIVSFSVNSDQTIQSVEWSMGDGSSYSVPAIQHGYAAAGEYEVSVLITAVSGCENSASTTFTVSGEPELSDTAIKNVITANGDSKNSFLYIENLDRHPENEVRFIDRWGVEIFSKKNYQNDWEAKGKDGHFLPAGQYICIVKLNTSGKVIKRTVSIIKG